MKNLDLSDGTSSLVQAIQKRFPNTTHKELEKISNRMLIEISSRIASGESLAFLKPNHDGSYDLTVYGLEVLEKVKKGY